MDHPRCLFITAACQAIHFLLDQDLRIGVNPMRGIWANHVDHINAFFSQSDFHDIGGLLLNIFVAAVGDRWGME